MDSFKLSQPPSGVRKLLKNPNREKINMSKIYHKKMTGLSVAFFWDAITAISLHPPTHC